MRSRRTVLRLTFWLWVQGEHMGMCMHQNAWKLREKYTSISPDIHRGKVIWKSICGERVLRNFKTWIDLPLIHLLAHFSSPALANEGLLELKLRPSLIRAAHLVVICRNYLKPGCSVVKLKLIGVWLFHLATTGFSVASADDETWHGPFLMEEGQVN